MNVITENKAVISLLGLALFMILAAGSLDSSKTPTKSSSKTSTKSTPVTNLTWGEIDKIYDLKSNFTELQKKEEWKKYEGKRVKWSGKVSHIGETFGTISLQVKIDPDTFTSDLLIRLKDTEKEKALKLKEGDSVTFTGTLDDWGTFMPITLDDGEIIE